VGEPLKRNVRHFLWLMRLSVVSMFFLLCVSTALAQSGNSDRCEVKTLDITGQKLDEIEKVPEKTLGRFNTVIAEETLTSRVYRLPKTAFFVIASVWYTDESMASEKGADSISLELLISKSRRRSVLNAVHFSDAEVPVNTFDVARATTMVKSKNRTLFVIIECRKDVRR
jgi:hypothetical protein